MNGGRGPIRWWAGDPRVQAALNALLAGPRGVDREPGAVIQSNAHRTLLEVLVPLGNDRDPERRRIVLKTHHVATGRHRLRNAVKRRLGRSAARREWQALTALHAAGVPVPRPLAYGRLPSGDELVAFEFIEGATLRDRFADADAATRAQLVANLGASLQRLHAGGLIHGDLHLGNLRARAETDEIVLLDLQRVRRAQAPGDRLRDLASLELSLLRANWPAADRATLRRVLAGGPAPGPAFDAALRRFAADHLRGRARRRLRPGHGFERVCAGRRVGLRDRSLSEAALLEVLERAERSPSRRVRRAGRGWISEIEIGGRAVVVKWREAGAFVDRLAAVWRGSAAARAFRLGQRARLLLEYTARPLAYLDARSAGLPGACWLVLERVGDVDLDEHCPPTAPAGRALACALGDWLADLHALGLGHDDLKGSNIRLRPTGVEGGGVGVDVGGARGSRSGESDAMPQGSAVPVSQPRFWLVDLEDLRGPGELGDEARLLALAQLNASIPDARLDPEARGAALTRYLARLPFESAELDFQRVRAEVARRSVARAHRWRGEGCAADAAGIGEGPGTLDGPGDQPVVTVSQRK